MAMPKFYSSSEQKIFVLGKVEVIQIIIHISTLNWYKPYVLKIVYR